MYPRWDDESGRYGYWGDAGWVIHPQFAYAHDFVHGYASVDLLDGRYGLLGRDGTVHDVHAICGGRRPVREELQFFTGFSDLSSRYAAICTGNRRRHEWGLIDTSLTYRPLPNEV